MTFMLLGLPAIPKPSVEAREKESKLEEQLRSLVTGEVRHSSITIVNY